MTQTMLDKIAEAMVGSISLVEEFQALTKNEVYEYVSKRAARAALTAMMEPSDAVIQAGNNADWPTNNLPEQWPAMIQAILNEGSEK